MAAKVNLGIWEKLSRLVILLLVIAGCLAIALWYLPLIRQNENMRHEILQLEMQIQKEERTARELKSAIDALRNDEQTVERLARERLGYAKPGETVIRFESQTNNQRTRRSE